MMGYKFLDTDVMLERQYHNTIGTVGSRCGVRSLGKGEKTILIIVHSTADSYC